MAKATKAAAPKAEGKGPEHKMRMRVGRTIGRGVWLTGYDAEHPNATKEERAAAWDKDRKDFTKIGLRALKALERKGYQVTERPEAAE